MLDGVRAVLNHHGAGAHTHAGVERHQHDAATGDVVYLDDDAAGADTVKNPAGKRLAADLDTPTIVAPMAVSAPPIGSPCFARACAFESHIGDLLGRPPR